MEALEAVEGVFVLTGRPSHTVDRKHPTTLTHSL